MTKKLDLSLSEAELEDFLASERTVRVASVDAGCRPHVVPLWFVWLEGAMYLNSTLGNVTVENLLRGSGLAAAVVDDGQTYDVLRGVLLRGRVSLANDDPRAPRATQAWSDKYLAGNPVPYDRWLNRVWMRLDPGEISSWDFRKIPEAKARQRGSEGAS
jgi:nitroimidazol reductase NimA-like FMN-containing flavoprotein (pyridoxamine 5'-phosphate oxidase superfamily)